MKDYDQEDRRRRLEAEKDDELRLKLLYEWVKTGVMPFREFREIIEQMDEDSFEAGRAAGLDGQEGPGI